jgi:hypothetical protein
MLLHHQKPCRYEAGKIPSPSRRPLTHLFSFSTLCREVVVFCSKTAGVYLMHATVTERPLISPAQPPAVFVYTDKHGDEHVAYLQSWDLDSGTGIAFFFTGTTLKEVTEAMLRDMDVRSSTESDLARTIPLLKQAVDERVVRLNLKWSSCRKRARREIAGELLQHYNNALRAIRSS